MISIDIQEIYLYNPKAIRVDTFGIISSYRNEQFKFHYSGTPQTRISIVVCKIKEIKSMKNSIPFML